MSSINGTYTNYSSMLFGAQGSSVSKSNNIYDIIQSYNSASSAYGKNLSELSAEQSESIVDFKNYSANLFNSLGKLLSENNDGSTIFGSYKASTSDSEALSVNYKSDVDKYSSEALEARRNPNYSPEAPESFAVKTLQLATTQRNTSALKSDEMALEAGKTYRFEIESGGEVKQYAFVAEQGDNNESVQNKIAAAINADKNSAVTATVSKSSDTGQSYLVVQSKQTGVKDGEENSFTIRDVSGYDAISKTGLDNVTQKAQNAEYLIGEIDKEKSTDKDVVLKDGAEFKTSMSNEIAVDDRTTITLKKTTDDYVKVNFEKDTLQGINATRDFVNNYNALLELANDNRDNKRSKMLLNQLSELAQTYNKSLSEIGISRDETGYLKIDEDKMKKAAESGALENFFTSGADGIGYGFNNRLASITKSVNDNPTQYVGSSATSESGSSNAQNFWNEFNSGSSNYSKLYFNMQKYENIGALFNSLF